MEFLIAIPCVGRCRNNGEELNQFAAEHGRAEVIPGSAKKSEHGRAEVHQI